MEPIKAVHELFLFEDDLFWNEAEIIRNEACTGMKRNTSSYYFQWSIWFWTIWID